MSYVVGLVITCEAVAGKDRLKVVTVDIGNGVVLTIATNAPNIREGTRTCVAVVGSTIEIAGQSEVVKKTNVGGIISEGMICDSVMLGWAGGAAGLAVQIPASYELGAKAPTSKPRMDGSAAVEAAPELSAKEIKAAEKLARKAELAAKKEARLAAKKGGAGAAADENEAAEEGEGEAEADKVEGEIANLKI